MDKQEYHNRIKSINKCIFSNGLSKILFNKIIEKAESDKEYMAKFLLWLNGKESTVFLRDELASIFENDSFIKNSEAPCPFFNAWSELDSASSILKGIK